jgi:hypothetical protein
MRRIKKKQNKKTSLSMIIQNRENQEAEQEDENTINDKAEWG